jgi:hypothetical protein
VPVVMCGTQDIWVVQIIVFQQIIYIGQAQRIWQ